MNESGFRFENKFEITLPAAMQLKSMLQGVLQADPHAGPDGYLIHSIYFDDLDYHAYRDKVDGVRDRSKLRLRYYNSDESYIVFENKEKIGNLTRKTSMRVTSETARQLLAGKHVSNQRGQLLNLYHALLSSGLQPRVLVDYHRLPFVYPVSNVRITIDMDVKTAPFSLDLFNREQAMLPVLDPGTAVLEVKYDEFLPPYLAELLNTVPMTRIAVSKYVKCLGILE